MRHLDRRLVPDPPASVVQSPDQVDVLAVSQRRIEDAAGRDRVKRRPPDQQRRGRHVRDPAGRHDTRRLVAEIEAAAHLLVPACRRTGRQRDDPRRDGADERIGQVRRECVDPARRRHAVAVEEGDQARLDACQAGVPSCAGTRAGGQPSHDRPVPPGYGADRGWVGRAVVDHHDRILAADGGQAAVQHGRSVPHRDHDGDVESLAPALAAKLGSTRSGREVGCAIPASVSRRPRTAAAAERTGPARSSASACRPAGVSRSTRAGDPPKSDPSLSCLVLAIQRDAEAARQRFGLAGPARGRVRRAQSPWAPSPVGLGHSARPPSTGTTAPVMPLLSGPARKASTAATSAGSSSRPAG